MKIITIFTILFALTMFTNANAEDLDYELDLEVEALLNSAEDVDREVAHVAAEKVDKAPAPFKKSTIKRKLKDGKVQNFDGDKYMIVRRRKYKKQEPVVVKEEVQKFKHIVSLHAGRGPDGDLSKDSGRIYTEHDVFLGLQYQYVNDNSYVFGLEVQTNESLSFSIGKGF